MKAASLKYRGKHGETSKIHGWSSASIFKEINDQDISAALTIYSSS